MEWLNKDSIIKCALIFASYLFSHTANCHQPSSYQGSMKNTGHHHNTVGTGSTGHGHADAGGKVKHMHHERPTGFHDPKIVHDQEHIQEHLEGVADMGKREMTQDELEFHYFKLHDFDNNTMLDGLEIYKALTHILPFDAIQEEGLKVDPTGKTPHQIKQEEIQAEQKYYTDIVDQVLQEDDIDGDGYLTYLEYVLARRREEHRNKQAAEKAKL